MIVLEEEPLRIFLLCAFMVAGLSSKLILNSLLQAINRYWSFRRRKEGWEPPEPESVHKGFAPLGSEIMQERLKMVWRNDLENFVPFSGLFLFSAMMLLPQHLLQAVLAIFLGTRFLHTLSLLGGLLPLRVLCYITGLILQILMVHYILLVIAFLS